MRSVHGQFHPTRFSDVAVTIDFHCNSACRFCIVQEGMNDYEGLGFEQFARLVDENLASKKYGRIYFTGGEVTLYKRLFEYLGYVQTKGGFEHVRIQTNGRRLSDRAFAEKLRAAGVDELFVSIHGDGPEVHDRITQRPGSYDELIKGLEHAIDLGFFVVTNTVLNRMNVQCLDGIVKRCAERGVRDMEFWNYLPMEDFEDRLDLIPRASELLPALKQALDLCEEHEVRAVVKYVPRCLLAEHADRLDNSQPDVIIVESFWDQFPRFNCLYEAVCEHSEACMGLHHPYINKYGWEEDRLAPVPRVRPWNEAEQPLNVEERIARPELHSTWYQLAEGAEAHTSATLVDIEVSRNEARYRYELGGDASVDIVLTARTPTRPALARSRSFNIAYSRLRGEVSKPAVMALLESFVEVLRERDQGDLSLDARKGIDPATGTRRNLKVLPGS